MLKLSGTIKKGIVMFASNRFKNKRILVGITGGIAAYKSIEIIRYLITNQAEVRVVMTPRAEKFITRLTMETLSQNAVAVEMFPENRYTGTHHIRLSDWAQAAIIAPATYNFIGKIHAGIADDLLSTIVAALHCPVVLAPAMNLNMWNNPVLHKNLEELQELGFLVCPPEEGFLAEGYSGIGRLACTAHLLQFLYRAVHPAPQSLNGKKVVVTAGRTEEAFDPVRFISNRASGKMGFALAWEAFARGAEVILVHGPGHLPEPANVNPIAVRTAEEMYESVRQQFADSHIYLGAAAVSDYKPGTTAVHKIKKQNRDISISLKPTPDILEFAGKNKKKNQLVVGFAIETEQAEENARKKLNTKNLDLMALNNPLENDSGFETDTNRVTLFDKAGRIKQLPVLSKLDVAFELFDFLLHG